MGKCHNNFAIARSFSVVTVEAHLLINLFLYWIHNSFFFLFLFVFLLWLLFAGFQNLFLTLVYVQQSLGEFLKTTTGWLLQFCIYL